VSESDLKPITLYVSVWFWQVLAIVFLCTSFIMIALPRNASTVVFSISLIVIFAVCEYKSFKRREEFYG